RNRSKMSSTFVEKYSNLLPTLSTLKPIPDSVDDEIIQLGRAINFDEITNISTSISRNVIEAQSIMDDYNNDMQVIKSTIATMDDTMMQDKEQDYYEEQERSTDSSTGLTMNPVSLSRIVSKLDTKYKRTLESTTNRALWKSNSRLTNSNLPSESNSPIFIPTSRDATLAKLIISDIHKSSTHASVDIVINEVKKRYWIPRFCSRRSTPSHITSDMATTFKMASTLWKMARILSLTEKSATLKSHTGRIIERPLNLLIPLEIQSNESISDVPRAAVTIPLTPVSNIHPMVTRSRMAP
ncbi:hypothetical protein PENTCL1PPCAC_1618, partial [Pristionchus entomophagus]